MSCTIDHLRIDHRVTVLRDFTDSAGVMMRAGESGILRGLSFDQIRLGIHMGIENDTGMVELLFSLKAQAGPRNGHMREYFEMGDPVPGNGPASSNANPTAAAVSPHEIAGPDRLEEVEQSMQRAADHIGVALSIAEMYARRMRAFQRAGNGTRAEAAFKLAVGWMDTYASWATSGGEGAALSRERDSFHASLVRELGYDPTAAAASAARSPQRIP